MGRAHFPRRFCHVPNSYVKARVSHKVHALTPPEAEAAIKPDSQKTYLEQAKDTIAGKADVSLLSYIPLRRAPQDVTRQDRDSPGDVQDQH